jgi:hypothetical protein
MEQLGRILRNDVIGRQCSIVFRHRPCSPPNSLNVNVDVDDEDGSFDLEFAGLPTSCYLAHCILSWARSTTLGLPLVQMSYPAPDTVEPLLDYPLPGFKSIVDAFLTLHKVPFIKPLSRSTSFSQTVAPGPQVPYAFPY